MRNPRAGFVGPPGLDGDQAHAAISDVVRGEKITHGKFPNGGLLLFKARYHENRDQELC